MKKRTRQAFVQLDAQNKAKQRVLIDFGLTPRQLASIYPKGSVGYFADELGLPVELLIGQLELAGVRTLTPAHKVHETHKTQLLNYLRKVHRNEPKSPPQSILVYEQKLIEPARIELIQDINEELLRLISITPDLLYRLPPRKFEELVARLFADRGYEVSLTKPTRDGGYDLLAKFSDGITTSVVLAECKRYEKTNKVGVEVVRGLYGVTEMHRANQGLVITSSYFTKDAVEEQLRLGNRVGLRDFNNLVEWLKPYSTQQSSGSPIPPASQE